MLNTLRTNSTRNAGIKATVAALLLAGSGASMAAPYDLCATSGTAVMPGTGESVTVLGYASNTGGTCAAISAPGSQVILEAVAGESMTVNLHNNLGEATGLVFQGQVMPPDLTGTTTDKSYTFTPANPGTYLFQAAPLANAEHQVAMGLYGVLLVRPSGTAVPYTRTDAGVVLTTTSGVTVATDAAALATDVGASVSGPGIPAGTTIASVTGTSVTLSAAATVDATVSLVISKSAGQGYAAATTAFDEESTLVLSELDPALTLASAATFDMRDYAPKYFLINGKAYPGTDAIASAAGHKLLLRYVNAGSQHHSMATLGLRQNFIAKDGSVLPTANVAVTAETLAPGQTADALVTMPATLAAASQFAVYDAGLKLHNSSNQGIGGMLTFVSAPASVAAAAAPVASAVTLTPSLVDSTTAAVTLAATITSSSGNVTAAEYFLDGTGGTSHAFTIATPATSVSVSANVLADLATLSAGSHIFYVHGLNATGWGAFASAPLVLDRTGPTTSALTLSPNPSSGSVPVTLTASASDVATGGANIKAFDYWLDSLAHTTVDMTTSGPQAPVRGLTATIPAPLTAGTHTVSVRSQDALNNWGAAATITLTVSAGGPVTSFQVPPILPGSSNNGAYGLSSGQPVVRVRAIESSAAAPVTAAEGFFDACPAATTRGFPFVPAVGVWGGTTVNVTADIPLANISRLGSTTHPIFVRGRDSTGAWGACVSTPLLIDKSAPVLASGSLAPTTVAFGTATVTLTFSATDTGGAGIAGVQYWFDSATPPGNPRSAVGTTSAALDVSTLRGGNRTVYFRARDAANNVSNVLSAQLTVVQAVDDRRFNVNADNSLTQTVDTTNNNQRVLANDLPAGGTRTAVLLSVPVRTRGNGQGKLAISCAQPANAGTAVSGNALCTNGDYRLTLTGVGANGNARRTSKSGTYQFTYQMNRDGVLSNAATVTIRVQ